MDGEKSEKIDDDSPQLSAHALKALEEFLAERNSSNASKEISEDWELSQFWYDEATKSALAKECLEVAGKSAKIACIAAPSVFSNTVQISKICKKFRKKSKYFKNKQKKSK